MDEELKKQFAVRSTDFDISANWISDKELIRTHVDLAGKPSGKALDLCCGTGRIGRALKVAGWDVQGLDICTDMVRISSGYFSVSEGKAEKLPFDPALFKLIVCRQAFQFLNVKSVLAEITRGLAPGGTFIISLTVPFSDEDRAWLSEIHRMKQSLLLKFYTAQDLTGELRKAGFHIQETRTLKVRESITKWMSHAPELSVEIRQRVISAVQCAPAVYKKWHHVEVVNGEVLEDWNWIVLKASL